MDDAPTATAHIETYETSSMPRTHAESLRKPLLLPALSVEALLGPNDDSPPAESELPPEESELPPAESELPPAESEFPSAESELPTPESPPAESE